MVNDSNIITIDSIESKMKVNKFSGNQRQATREEKNLYNVNDYSDKSTMASIDDDDWITLQLKSAQSVQRYLNYLINCSEKLKTSSTYYLVIEIKEFSGTGSLVVSQYLGSAKSQISTPIILDFSSLTTGIQKYTVSTVDDFTDINYMIRTFASFPIGSFGKIIFRLSLLEEEPDLNTFVYQKYGASPSLDYPSKVKAVGDNVNMFDKDNANKINATPSAGTIIESSNGKSFYLEIKPNTDYSISRKIVGQRFTACTTTQVPAVGVSTNQNVQNNTGNEIHIKAGENDKYLLVYYLYNSTENEEEILSSIKVEEGEEATAYSKYGQGSVEVKKINKNLLPQVEIGDINVTTGQDVISSNVFRSDFISVSYNNTYVWSTNKTLTYGKPNLRFYDKDKKYLGYGNFTGNTYTVNDKDIAYIRIRCQLSAEELESLEDFEFQIEKGDVASAFVEHEEQSYVLPIQQPMLSGDYFVKEADGWKEVHTFNKKIFDGTENIGLTNNQGSFSFLVSDIPIDTNTAKIPQLFSNCYEACSWEDRSGNNKPNTISYYYQTIGFDKGNLTTIDEFKQLLAQKNTEGNPVYVYYPLATPTKLPCTEAQITVLNQLQNIILYDDTTNIILPDVYPILDYDVSKIIDTTTTFEASLDSNGYFVVPDYDIKCLISYSESDIPSMPEAVETAVSVPGRDGDIPLNTIYNPISFTIVCYTEDNLTPEEKYAEETKMNKFLNSIKNNTIKLKLESKGKYYDVKYNGQLTTINYPKHLQFSIPLKSSSSYAKDIDEYYILGNGEKESSTIKEVGAVFVIEGPAQTPKISLNDYEMFYDNVLLSNTKLVIDSNKSTVTMINREGTATNAMRYYNHEFPKIQNGNNVLKVLSGIDEDRQVNVRWFDLKL